MDYGELGQMTRTVADMSLSMGHMSDFYNPSLKKCQKHQRLFKHGEDTTLLKSDAGNRQIPPPQILTHPTLNHNIFPSRSILWVLVQIP